MTKPIRRQRLILRRTKLHIEEILRDLAVSDDRWRIAALRYFNPWELTEVALSEMIPTAFPITSCPLSCGWPQGNLRS